MAARRRRSSSLFLKLLLAFTGLVLVVVASMTLLSIYRDRTIFREELQNQANLLLDTLAMTGAERLYFLDVDFLSGVTERLYQEKMVRLARFYGPEGRILADANDPGAGLHFGIDPFGQQLLEAKTTIFDWQGEHLIAGQAIVFEEQILGAVSVGVSTTPLKRKLTALRNQGLVNAFVAAILGIILAAAISRSITGPIGQLVDATEHIAKGDLTHRIVTAGDDDIALLANAMEHMRVELQELYRNFERLVDERTRALQESESRAKSLLNAIPDMMFRLDSEGTYLDYKAETSEIYAQSEDAIIGKNNRDFMPPEFVEMIQQHIDATLTTGEMQVFEYQLPIPGAGVQDYEARMVASAGHEVIAIVRNITQRKCKEEQRLQLQSTLRQAQKMEAIGKLAGGTAHEFNNILAIILGSLELSLADLKKEDGKLKTRLEEAYRAGERGRDLVKQVLVFSRSSKQTQQVLSPVSILQTALKMVQNILPPTIEIREEIDPASCPILTNPLQLEQIVINLCRNAAQAIGDQQGRVDISLQNIEYTSTPSHFTALPSGEYVKLAVSDTGPGMPLNIKNRIFDPFFTTKEVGRGTGLGLSTVHGIVQQHNGYIGVESEPGKGTRFEILFPVDQSAKKKSIRGDSFSVLGRKSSRKADKRHLLFVDDDTKPLRLPLIALEKLGFTVTIIKNGHEALSRFRSQPSQFDIVLINVSMAGIHGIDLCRKFIGILPEMPCILYAETQSSVDLGSLEGLGMIKFLEKPLKVSQLTQTLRELSLTSSV